MNSTQFLVALVSLMAVCQGQGTPTPDGEAAVTALITKIGQSDPAKTKIQTGLTTAIAAKPGQVQTDLKSAAEKIVEADIKLLDDELVKVAGADGSTTGQIETAATHFLDATLVTYKLNKALAPAANEAKILTALSTVIRGKNQNELDLIIADVSLLSDDEIKNAGKDLITAASGEVPAIVAKVPEFITNLDIATVAHDNTIQLLTTVLSGELTTAQSANLKTALTNGYGSFPSANRTELQKSTYNATVAQIVKAGETLIADAKKTTGTSAVPIPPATVTSFFQAVTAIVPTGTSSAPMLTGSLTLLIASTVVANVYRSI